MTPDQTLKEKIEKMCNHAFMLAINANSTVREGLATGLAHELLFLFQDYSREREKEVVKKVAQEDLPIGLRGCTTCNGYGYYYHSGSDGIRDISFCECIETKKNLLAKLSERRGK